MAPRRGFAIVDILDALVVACGPYRGCPHILVLVLVLAHDKTYPTGIFRTSHSLESIWMMVMIVEQVFRWTLPYLGVRVLMTLRDSCCSSESKLI